MKERMRWLAAACLPAVVGGVVLSLAGSVAMAQRPALVKNSDEPGRIPYEAEAEFNGGGCATNCVNFASIGPVVLFDMNSPVPAGKRLVIRHISGQVIGSQGCGTCAIGLQSSPVFAAESLKWSYPGPFTSSVPSTGVVVNGFSADPFVTVGPGEMPHVRVQAQGQGGYYSNIVISGYLIDATN